MVIGLFLVSFASAYDPHKQNTDLYYSFTSNNATQCNVTTANTPNGTITINQITTKSGQTFSSFIGAGNFTILGTYIFNIVCTDGSKFETGDFAREVTIDGRISSGTSTVIVFALIGLAFIFLVLSMFFKEDYWMVKSLFQFLAVGTGLIAINSARIIASDSDTLGKMGEVGIILMIVVMSIFFLWIFVYAFLEIIKVFKAKGDLRWDYS